MVWSVLIANPEFIPLFSTIVASWYLVGQTITSTIVWNDCYVIKYTYMIFVSSSFNQVTKVTNYIITQVTIRNLRVFDLFNILHKKEPSGIRIGNIIMTVPKKEIEPLQRSWSISLYLADLSSFSITSQLFRA
jgi:hypothetical protein